MPRSTWLYGVVPCDHLDGVRIITMKHDTSVLDQMNSAIQATRLHLVTRKRLFHHDNTSTHTSQIVVSKLSKSRKGTWKAIGNVNNFYLNSNTQNMTKKKHIIQSIFIKHLGYSFFGINLLLTETLFRHGSSRFLFKYIYYQMS